MADAISATFEFKSVLKALQNLPINIQKNVMTGATRAGANVVRDEARRLVPIDRGALKKSIGLIKRKAKSKNEVIFSITPRKGGKVNVFYSRFQELGTSKFPAKPYLRPAIENSTDEVLQATKDYIAARLPAEVAKAKR